MTVRNSEEVIYKMASLLEEAGVLEKRVPAKNEELNAIAGSLMTIADCLDAAGVEEAASNVDKALGKLAEVGCCPNVPNSENVSNLESKDMMRAASTALIGIADRLDSLNLNMVQDVDKALEVLAAKLV